MAKRQSSSRCLLAGPLVSGWDTASESRYDGSWRYIRHPATC